MKSALTICSLALRHLRRRTVQQAVKMVSFFDVRMEALFPTWVGVMGILTMAKVATAPIPCKGIGECAIMALPFLLAAMAPIVGYRVAAGSFPRGLLPAQPAIRLARFGKWRNLDVVETRQNRLYGPTGFMVSLLVGILLNIPVRTLEYLAAVPAISPAAPGWSQVLVHAMTADVIVMNFLYMVCFVLALRSVPLFPRMLVFAWIMDIVMQLVITQQLARASSLPLDVAQSLSSLLQGNIDKVLISAALWLPYLFLSERVNITYRHRCSA